MKNKFSSPSTLLLSALREAHAERKTGKNHSFKTNAEAAKFIEKIITEKK